MIHVNGGTLVLNAEDGDWVDVTAWGDAERLKTSNYRDQGIRVACGLIRRANLTGVFDEAVRTGYEILWGDRIPPDGLPSGALDRLWKMLNFMIEVWNELPPAIKVSKECNFPMYSIKPVWELTE